MRAIYLTSDLLFTSRIASTAKQAGVGLTVVATCGQLAQELGGEPAQLLLVDLEHCDANLDEIMRSLAAVDSRPRVIAYGPHVKEELLAKARAAGCDEVLSRGEFNAKIAGVLSLARN